MAFLDIETLEYRRLKSDLVFYYKILNGVTLWPSDLYFTIQRHQRETRHTINRSTLYLEQPLCKTALFENEFFQRCISRWNALPNSVVQATSVKCFKDMLNNVDLSKYLKFNFKFFFMNVCNVVVFTLLLWYMAACYHTFRYLCTSMLLY